MYMYEITIVLVQNQSWQEIAYLHTHNCDGADWYNNNSSTALVHHIDKEGFGATCHKLSNVGKNCAVTEQVATVLVHH